MITIIKVTLNKNLNPKIQKCNNNNSSKQMVRIQSFIQFILLKTGHEKELMFHNQRSVH